MLVFKALVILFLQACFLLKESTGNIRHIDAYIGRSTEKHCDCGTSYFHPLRIIDKTETNETVKNWREYPWMVGILYQDDSNNEKINCGGTLIDTQYVLTAAHCLEGLLDGLMNISQVRVAVGVRHTEYPVVTIGITAYFLHPTYDYNQNMELAVNDIAILRLEKPVFFGKFLKPVCLGVDPKMTRVGRMLKVLGFGYITPGGNRSSVLRGTSLPIKKIAECKKIYGSTVVNPTSICSGGRKDEDACQGDSGGPLFYTDSDDKNRAYQVGIVSMGPHGCGEEGVPAIYTRVNAFIHWIRNISSDAPSCEQIFPPKVGYNYIDCGIPERLCKINATDCNATEFTFSWMTRIFYKNKLLGTGVLINHSFILTNTRVLDPWYDEANTRDLHVIIGQRGEGHNDLDSTEYKSNVSHVLYHLNLKLVPVVILALDAHGAELALLHRPICMPDPGTVRDRTGEELMLMFWKEKGTSKKKKIELKTELVKVVETKRCSVPDSMKNHAICAVMKGTKKCHENGAILMNFVGGRIFMIGVVSPRTKRCSKVKKFMDITWNFNWIHYTIQNML